MKESIHQYFKVGTLLWMSYPAEDPLTALKKIVCDDYFDVIELSHMEDPATRAQARRMTEEGLMHVGYGAHPTILGRKLNPNALDEETRLAAEKALLDEVDEAAELGAKGIAFLAGKWDAAHEEEGFFREDDPLILSFEVKPFGGEDPDIVLANCKRALNRA